MYNSRASVGSKVRQASQFTTSLGNVGPRYDSEVGVQRKKYLLSSTRNSEETPEWMSRTQTFHYREHNRNRSMFTNANSGFKHVQQTNIYARTPKTSNPEGQFNRLVKPRARSKWEMKGQTFEFEWPRPKMTMREEANPRKESLNSKYEAAPLSGPRLRQMKSFDMPKYGYFESPLHRQRDTALKIGHPQLLNTTYVK